jgi:uncharacterized protein YqfB (UPF0267 family)
MLVRFVVLRPEIWGIYTGCCCLSLSSTCRNETSFVSGHILDRECNIQVFISNSHEALVTLPPFTLRVTSTLDTTKCLLKCAIEIRIREANRMHYTSQRSTDIRNIQLRSVKKIIKEIITPQRQDVAHLAHFNHSDFSWWLSWAKGPLLIG